MSDEERRIRELLSEARKASVQNSSVRPKNSFSIHGVMAWLLPVVLAFMVHSIAGPKADMSENGMGKFIANRNEETIQIISLWHVVAEHYWFFGVYAGLLLAIFGVLGYFRVRFAYRFICWVFVAAPGFWYFWKMAYLSGKILSFG